MEYNGADWCAITTTTTTTTTNNNGNDNYYYDYQWLVINFMQSRLSLSYHVKHIMLNKT